MSNCRTRETGNPAQGHESFELRPITGESVRCNGVGIRPEVGYRLAALADGEGCFSITGQLRASRGRGIISRQRAPNYQCSFIVQMRADDRAFVEKMAAEIGLGTVRLYNAEHPTRRNKPVVRWVIWRRDECRALTRIFDAYPLWSKKRRDYEIWRSAVWTTGAGRADAFRLLREIREYRPVPIPVVEKAAVPDQLEIEVDTA